MKKHTMLSAFIAVSVSSGWSTYLNSAQRAEFFYHAPTTLESNASPTQSSITKKDIVIVGDEITVDSPLNSYGGDILILADTLRIKAPIDTRPYLTFERPYWSPSPPPAPGISAPAILGNFPNLLDTYDSYLYWTETWDPTKYKFSRAPGKIIWQNGQITGIVPQPFSPVAFIDHGTPGRAIGRDAPPANRRGMRSGSIFIYTRRLELCTDDGTRCPPSVSESKSPHGGPYDYDRVGILFISDGIMGGLGAPGSLHLCYGVNAECANWGMGLSGLGGAGQDAGNIQITLLDGISDETIATLQNRASAKGGPPPYLGRFYAGSFNAFTANRRDGLAYQAEEEKRDITGLTGKSGTVQIVTSSNYPKSISEVAATLSGLSVGKSYQLEPMIRQLQNSLHHLWIDPRSLLLTHIREKASRGNLRSLDGFRRALDNDNAITAESPGPSLLKLPNNCDVSKILTLDENEKILTKTACFATLDAGDIRSSLLRSGGVFRTIPEDVTTRISDANLAAEINFLNTQTAQSISEIAKVGGNVLLLYNFEQRKELANHLQQAKAALEATKAKMDEKASKLQGLMSPVGFIRTVASLYSLGVAYDTAAEILAKPDGTWEAAGEELNKHKGSSDYLVEIFQTISESNDPDLSTLQQNILNASEKLNSFDRKAKAEREESAASIGAQTKVVIELGSRLENKWTDNILLFDTMTRAVIQSYLAAPDGNQDRLSANLTSIRNRLADPTAAGIALDLQGVKNLCTGSKPTSDIRNLNTSKCVRVQRDPKSFRIFWGHISKHIELPFLVVAPGKGAVDVTLIPPKLGALRETSELRTTSSIVTAM